MAGIRPAPPVASPPPSREAAQPSIATPLPADGLRGYADVRQSVAKHLNRHLYNAARLDNETQRILGRLRKVHR